MQIIFQIISNDLLASCPWGPATAHGVGILIKLHVIYMERCSSHRAIKNEAPRSNGLGATGLH